MIAPFVRNPLTIAGMVLALNVPFGYWRFRSKRMSIPWFFAIHLPVAMAIGLRWLIGVHFRWLTLPLYVGAFVVGQSAGGRLRKRAAELQDGID